MDNTSDSNGSQNRLKGNCDHKLAGKNLKILLIGLSGEYTSSDLFTFFKT